MKLPWLAEISIISNESAKGEKNIEQGI